MQGMARTARRIAALLAASGAVLIFASGASAAPVAPVLTGPVSPTNAATIQLTWTSDLANTGGYNLVDYGATCTAVASAAPDPLDVSPRTVTPTAGTHCYRVWAFELLNPIPVSSNTLTIVIDRTAPAVPVLAAPADNSFANGPIALTATGGEAGAVIAFTVNGPGTGGIVAAVGPYTPPDQGVYTFTVHQTDAAGNASAASGGHDVTYDTVNPTAPVVSGAAFAATAPTVTWTASTDAVSGLDHYHVYRGATAIGGDIAPAAARTYTDATAPDGAVSSYTVHAFDNAGNDVISAPLAVRRDTTGQSAPRALTATAFSRTSPQIGWQAPPATAMTATRYEVSRNATRVGTVTTTSFTDTTPAEGAYDYTVTAFDAAGLPGAASKSVHVIVDRTDPVGSGLFGASPNPDGSVTFGWGSATDALSGVDGYQVRRIDGLTAPATTAVGDLVCAVDAPGLSCRDAAANASGSSFALFAIDRAGNSVKVGELTGAQVRDKVPPSPPKKLRLVRARSAQALPFELVSARWTNPPNSDFLRVVLVRNTKRPPRTRVDGKIVYGSNGTAARVRIEAGRTTYLALFALDRAGNVSKPVRTQVVLPSLSLLAPRDGSQYPAGSKVALSWPAVEGADYYNVQVYLRGKKIASVWPTTPKLSYDTTGLAPGTYVWYVWPASEVKGQAVFGSSIGRSTFQVTVAP
jgi:fibronectin type 3 domain-containing protein